MSERWSGWTLLLLASGSVWAASRDESPRISPEVSRSPLATAAGPGPAPFIRSIEVTRPDTVELRVIAAPERERLARLTEPPPACDAAPRTLLRAGCPEAPPEVGPCAEEGQDCRYETAGSCVARHQCLYGLWSPLGVVCPDAEPGQLLAGTGPCDTSIPVADAPCAEEGLSCVHRPCGFGDQEVVAECRCGRWYQRWQACPITR